MFDSLLDRSVVFSFTRGGFRRHARRFSAPDLNQGLAGRIFAVTGANSGLGLATARGLAERGAIVELVCRSVERGEAALDLIARESPHADLRLSQLDVSDLASVREYAQQRRNDPLDVLIHNAGILPATYTETPKGFESALATNLLGPFLLTRELLPALKGSSDGRVILVSSGGMYSARLSVGALGQKESNGFDGVKAYAQTKRAQVILAHMLQKRLGGIAVSSMHPGWADTPGVETSLPRFYRLSKRFLRTPEQGADTILWLAISTDGGNSAGRFYFDREPVDEYMTKKTKESSRERERLWEFLCDAVGIDPESDWP